MQNLGNALRYRLDERVGVGKGARLPRQLIQDDFRIVGLAKELAVEPILEPAAQKTTREKHGNQARDGEQSENQAQRIAAAPGNHRDHKKDKDQCGNSELNKR